MRNQPSPIGGKTAPLYRLMALDVDGRVIDTTRLRAADDDAAINLAQALASKNAVELWDGLRFIEQFGPCVDTEV